MNFRDQWVTDEDGEKFIFTVEMQRKLAEAGLPVEPESLSDLNEGRNGSGRNGRGRGSSSSGNDKYDFQAPGSVQIDPQTGKYIGRVKWYNGRKGYGFIVRGGGEEIFFHRSNTTLDPNRLDEGQWVLYDVEHTKKGPEATEVEPYQGEIPV